MKNRISVYYPDNDGDNMPDAPNNEPATALERKLALLADHVRMVAQGRMNGLFVVARPGLSRAKAIQKTLLDFGIVPVVFVGHIQPVQLYRLLLENSQSDEVILLDTFDYWNVHVVQVLLEALHGQRLVYHPPDPFFDDLPQSFHFHSRIIFSYHRIPRNKPFNMLLRNVDVVKLDVSNQEIIQHIRHLAAQGFGMLSPAECHEVVDVIGGYADTRRLSVGIFKRALNRREYALTAHVDWRELVRCQLNRLPPLEPNRETGVRPMIEVPADKLPIESAAVPYKVKLDVEWPKSIQHRGARYRLTGKEGVRFKDNMPTAEYEVAGTGRRAWLGIDGAIEDD